MERVFKSEPSAYSDVAQGQLWLDAHTNITNGLYWGSNQCPYFTKPTL